MSQQVQPTGLSVEAYVTLEQETGMRYEYHDGEIVAMAGGSYDHTTISGNVFTALTLALRQRKQGNDGTSEPCVAANENRKIYIPSQNRVVYPDAVVVCGKPERPVQVSSAITNPRLIIEVLSKTTEAYDRGDKFRFYRQFNSFQEYLLIHQYRVAAEVWQRQQNTDLWQFRHYEGINQQIILASLGIELNMQTLYENVEDLTALLGGDAF